MHMRKGKARDKKRQFINLMRKVELRDKLRKFTAVVGVGELSEELRKLIAIVVLEIIVFGLAFGIVVRFFPDYTYVYNAIIIFFVCAIGITIMLYGNATRNRYLNVMGLLVLLFAVYVVIEMIEGFAVKISAFATLAVAIAAFAAIEENRRMRLERQRQEQEVQKEKMLNEINDWARKILKNMLLAARFTGSVSEYKKSITECKNELLMSMAESIKVRAICNNLSLKTQISASEEEKIKTSMGLVDKSLNSFVEKLLYLDIEKLKGQDVKDLVEGGRSTSHEVRSLLEIVSEIAVA